MNITATITNSNQLNGAATNDQTLIGEVASGVEVSGNLSPTESIAGFANAGDTLNGNADSKDCLAGSMAAAYGTPGRDGKDGYTPIKGVDYFDGKDGKDGYTPVKGIDYFDGKDGVDGYTPVKGVDYFDGKDGYTPVKGIDYFDGKDGYTPVKGVDYTDGQPGKDGADGQPGKDGYTPVKGVDYFDGEHGKDGKDGYTPQRGTDYWTSADKLEIFKVVYPVGAIYLSTVATNPATLFGFGTWEQIRDTFLLAAGGTYAAGSTGGEAAHKLTINEMPSHHHTSHGVSIATVGNSVNLALRSVELGNLHTGTAVMRVNNTGGGADHNNMPPYLAVYVWKRTA